MLASGATQVLTVVRMRPVRDTWAQQLKRQTLLMGEQNSEEPLSLLSRLEEAGEGAHLPRCSMSRGRSVYGETATPGHPGSLASLINCITLASKLQFRSTNNADFYFLLLEGGPSGRRPPAASTRGVKRRAPLSPPAAALGSAHFKDPRSPWFELVQEKVPPRGPGFH